MNYNLTAVADTVFGKFLSCALMSNPENIAGHDMSKLNIELTLDGQILNFQAVFSAFERQLGPDGTVQVSSQTPQSSIVPPGSLQDIINGLLAARDSAYSVNSMVESATSDVISAASSVAADCASEYASERVSESAWEHSPGDSVNDDVTSELDSAIEALQSLNEDRSPSGASPEISAIRV